MNNNSVIRPLLVGVVFGGLTFIVAFLGGAAITFTLGPGTSGVITVIATTIIVVNGGLILPRLGTLFLINIVFSVCAIPTQLFGPIGAFKILLGIGTGVIYEIPRLVAPNKPKAAMSTAAGIAAFCSVYGIYYLTGLQNARSKTLEDFLHYFAITYGVLAVVGAILGVMIFEKYIKNTAAVRRLGEE